MKRSPMQSIAPAAMIDDYEQARSAALTSRPAAVTRRWLQQLVAEGLYAWLMTRSGGVKLHKRAPTWVDVSSTRTAQLKQHHAIVQLLASMAIQSLTEDNDVYLQRQ